MLRCSGKSLNSEAQAGVKDSLIAIICFAFHDMNRRQNQIQLPLKSRSRVAACS